MITLWIVIGCMFMTGIGIRFTYRVLGLTPAEATAVFILVVALVGINTTQAGKQADQDQRLFRCAGGHDIPRSLRGSLSGQGFQHGPQLHPGLPYPGHRARLQGFYPGGCHRKKGKDMTLAFITIGIISFIGIAVRLITRLAHKETSLSL